MTRTVKEIGKAMRTNRLDVAHTLAGVDYNQRRLHLKASKGRLVHCPCMDRGRR